MELLLFLPLALATVAFILHLISWWRLQEVVRYNMRTRYHFDNLGNPQFFYDALTDNKFIPPPGNTAFPDNYLFVSGVQTSVKPKQQRPAITTSNTETIDAFVVQEPAEEPPGESLLPGEKELFQLESGESVSLSVGEISDFMRRCKAEKIGKMKVFEKLGIKPGKGETYQVWSKFWNTIE